MIGNIVKLMIVLSVFHSCVENVGYKDVKELGLMNKSEQEILGEFGTPVYTDTLIVNEETSLHEHRRGLYTYMTKAKVKDLISIEKEFSLKNGLTLVVWFEEKNDTLRVIDALEWDPKKITF